MPSMDITIAGIRLGCQDACHLHGSRDTSHRRESECCGQAGREQKVRYMYIMQVMCSLGNTQLVNHIVRSRSRIVWDRSQLMRVLHI